MQTFVTNVVGPEEPLEAPKMSFNKPADDKKPTRPADAERDKGNREAPLLAPGWDGSK
jgi:hypothetical protein